MAGLCFDTHNHVNDGLYGAHLFGAGVICSCEVLSVILVCGDDRQSGLLGMKQLDELEKNDCSFKCLYFSRNLKWIIMS